MNRQLRSLLLTAGTLSLILLCTPAPVSGPSTEEGNPQIVAVVVDSLRNPVPGASVTIYRIPPAADTLTIPSGASAVATRLTDASGYCSFDSLPGGTYSLEAADPSSDFRALNPDIAVADSGSAITDTLTLARTGAVRGVVSRGGVPGVVASQNSNLRDAAIMVIIQEIEVAPKLTPQNGSYLFSSLPPGTYTILYYATDGFFSAKDTVTVMPGDTTPVDTVILRPVPRLLPPKSFILSYPGSHPSDTAPKTITLSWQKLDFDSLRWYEVERYDLAGPFDRVFTTTDTVAVDTVTEIPAGTTLTYVVRSVDRAFNKSANAGPLEVLVE